MSECGEQFNRLEYVVHDLHKILHHRVPYVFIFPISFWYLTIMKIDQILCSTSLFLRMPCINGNKICNMLMLELYERLSIS